VVGRLGDKLVDRFGAERVFVDVESIPPGVDFADEIERELSTCVVLLAIIGPLWLTAADARGSRRLDDPDDFVVLEIQTALERGVRVIPVLVDGAAMPRRDELPAALAKLARRHAVRLDHDTFRADAGSLLAHLDVILSEPVPAMPRPVESVQVPANNRYELGTLLGRGDISEVYRGRDTVLGRNVAVKVARADHANKEYFQQRLGREAQCVVNLDHPTIVAVYEVGDGKGAPPYIVMEYVDGRTLRESIASLGPLKRDHAMALMCDVVEALDFGHQHGVLHGGLEPANIMITRSGRAKVMDFGVAAGRIADKDDEVRIETIFGTGHYVSPEQTRGHTMDARSDVYVAGCVLFEALVGRPPFVGGSTMDVVLLQAEKPPEPPSAHTTGISPELDAVVLKALAKSPADRYQGAGELGKDLVRVRAGLRPSAMSQ